MIARTYQELPIELVDEPDAPTRLEFQPTKFQELVSSIRHKGQLQPGGVVPNGARYTVVYGHRRLLACKALSLDTYLAYVYQSTTEAMLDAQLDENVVRHDLTPVEEAYWFAQLLPIVADDTDALADVLHKSRDYVERRLNLLRGDPAVLLALKEHKINLVVAQLLNDYPHDGDRRVLLDAAVSGGATGRLVASWIHERKQIAASLGALPAIDPNYVPPPPPPDAPETNKCLFCGTDKQPYLMVPVWMHTTCKDIVDAILTRHAGGVHEQKDRAAAELTGARGADR